jgi:hypothetical protein
MVVEDRQKMVVAQSDYAPMHLYNLAADPYELNDLVNTPPAAAVQARLTARIRDWHSDVMSRANPLRWSSADVQRWRLWKSPPPPTDTYNSPEAISGWCQRSR